MSKSTVLIVDDSPFARSMVRRMGSAHGGYHLYETESGADAIELHRELKPDLTLLDLNIPGMDGFEVLTAIHIDSPGAEIVVITTDRQQKTIEKALTLGAYAVISRQPTPGQIAELLRTAPGVCV